MLKKLGLIGAGTALLVGGAATAASAQPVDVGATAHDNTVALIGVSPLSDSAVSFTWDGGYNITEGQPWGGVTTSQSGGAVINVSAGRSGSTGPADWFNAATSMPIGTDVTSDNDPSDLNFAFSGTLTIEGNDYPVVLGQGHTGVKNNWWFGGQGSGWKTYTFSPWAVTTPDGRYVISTTTGDSDDTFWVEEAGTAS